MKDDDEMNQLVWSVLTQGVLTTLVVRPLENDEYEVISGHRRLHAYQKAGIETVPALIYALDRDAAAIALVDSNLHREKILPSEKAFAYKLKMDALSRQGQRTDLTSTQVGRKLETAEIIGEQSGESKNQVRRYIRLTELIPQILSMVDAGKIALTPAVELSYLTGQEQQDLLETMESEDCTPSLSQAVQMKKLPLEGICRSPMIPEWRLQMMANLIFRDYLAEKDKVLALANSILASYQEESTEKRSAESLIAAKQRELARLSKKMDNYIEMRAEGDLSRELFRTKCAELEPQMQQLQKEIEMLSQQVQPKPVANYKEKLTVLQYALERYTHIDEGQNVPESVVEAFVVKIVVHPDSFDWYLRFNDDPDKPLHCTLEGKRKQTTKIMVSGGNSPTMDCSDTGCHQGQRELRNDRKFGTFTVTCEDVKADMYALSTRRRVHKWTDIRVNLYI